MDHRVKPGGDAGNKNARKAYAENENGGPQEPPSHVSLRRLGADVSIVEEGPKFPRPARMLQFP
jgi:hypothetical protein